MSIIIFNPSIQIERKVKGIFQYADFVVLAWWYIEH